MSDLPTGSSGIEETVMDTGAPGPLAADRLLQRGEILGRYVILEKVGQGGMGVVYAAYDPELDRKVALKLLRADHSGPDSMSDGRVRLLREAQAMARLSHPNVVTVHDVGVHERRVFLAMEYVEGQTLGAVMKKGPRPWREVLPMFIAAGRGLAAAHEAGLVHRDFKPDNVLIRRGGVVKVTDFGLARDKGPGLAREVVVVGVDDQRPAGSGEVTSGAETSHTRTGAVLGTPAYMAPEQHLGLPTDPRTDQFSFCVALYEALYGQRPFSGNGRAAVAIAVTEGRVEEAPAGSRVPTWLRQVVLRGLRPRADMRHASMPALIDALAADPGIQRRRRAGLLGAGLVVAAASFGLSRLQEGEARLCADTGRHLERVWDPEVRDRVRRALDGSGAGFAASTFERVNSGLNDYTAAWAAQRQDACEATQITGEQSQALMDQRMACLDQRLQAVNSVVTILSEADMTVAQNAVAAVADLPALAACSHTAALLAAVDPPAPEVAVAVAQVRENLGLARARGTAGQYEAGLVRATEALAAARATQYHPLVAEALYGRGWLLHHTGAEDEARKALEEAFFLAVRHRLDELASRSASELVALVSKGQEGAAGGRRWGGHARAHAEASGEALLRAGAIHALAGVAHLESAFDEAWALATEALEIRTADLGAKHAAQLPSLNLLGLIASDRGKYDEAQGFFERGLALGREVLGPDHPDLARPINNLAKIAFAQGKMDEAEQAFEQALTLLSGALGPDHRDVAQLHNNLAAVAAGRGDMEEAGRRFTLALGIWEKALGPEHPSVADGLNNLAVVASGTGDYAKARDYDQRALAIRHKTMAADHPALAQNYNNLGEDMRRLGDLPAALELHTKALEIWEAKLGPDHDDVAAALTARGYDLVLLGRAAEGVPNLERALKIRADLELGPVERAHTQWALAQALWDAPRSGGRDRARARVLAGQARGGYEAGGETKELPLVVAWLAAKR